MAKKRNLSILFPLGGLDRKNSYRQQQPYTTPDCSNVRPQAQIENRSRGGSRPGVAEVYVEDIGSDIRLLAPMIVALGDNFTAFSDVFSGTSMAAAWTAFAGGDLPNILTSLAAVDTTLSEGEGYLTSLLIDDSSAYTVEMYITPYNGEWHGNYKLYLRLDNSSPDKDDNSVVVDLQQTGSTGAYTYTLTSYLSGTPTVLDTDSGTAGSVAPGWLSASVSGDDITVYWRGTQIASETADAQAGLRVGFGMVCTEAGGINLASVFRVQYFSTSSIDGARTILVSSAGGDLYYEEAYGHMTQVSSDLTVRSDMLLNAAQAGQKLYVADYGDLRATADDGIISGSELDSATYINWNSQNIDADSDVCVISNGTGSVTDGTYEISSVAAGAVTLASAPGDGSCTFRIERGPKIYDPASNTLALWLATAGKGQVPTGNPLVAFYLNRIVLAGADIAPHVWYMSRQGDSLDFDYSQTDVQAAVAGTASEAGIPGEAILALAPFSDDYLIFGCRYSLWRMRGDPAYGGSLDNVSRVAGIIGRNAWTYGPSGELIFLSLDGIWVLPPGGESVPISISREVLPAEFRTINPETTTVSLEYDFQDRGIHIYLTEDSSNARTHWWLDWGTKTFWPLSMQSGHEPTSTCLYQSTAIEDSGVLLGCRDGKIRRFTALAENDSGTPFTSYVMIGPVPLASDGIFGNLQTMEPVLAIGSGSVTWSTHPASTFEGAINASSSDTGTWTAGLGDTVYAQCRGQAFVLKLSGTSKWGMEHVSAVEREGGRRRVI